MTLRRPEAGKEGFLGLERGHRCGDWHLALHQAVAEPSQETAVWETEGEEVLATMAPGLSCA